MKKFDEGVASYGGLAAGTQVLDFNGLGLQGRV